MALELRHLSSGQWTLTFPRRSIWTSNFKLSHVSFLVLHMCVYFNQESISISSSIFNKKIFTSYPNLAASTLWPLDLLKVCWNNEFFLPMPSLWSWPLHASGQSKTNVNDSELDCPWHQGWYEFPSSLECNPGQERIKLYGLLYR